MAEPTLESIFGTGATQDANTLTIQKSALANVGLTANSTNTGESLLAAILKVAGNTLTPLAQQTNPDQNLSVQYANTIVVEFSYGTRLRESMLVGFDSPFSVPGITPDSY